MYCDESLKINFPMPEGLEKIVRELDRCCKGGTEDDDYDFVVARDRLEVSTKSALLNKRINEKQFELLWRRYGLR